MALQKQNLSINFAKGVDQKSDPFQIPPGKFAELVNSEFTKMGMLAKRPGFPYLPSLPDASATIISTFKGNLTAIGTKLEAFIEGTDTWSNKGNVQPAKIDTLSLIRNNTNQTQVDAVISDSGVICAAYSDFDGSTTTYKYAIIDSSTGQNIIAPVAIPITSGAITGVPRVFLLGRYFIIVFTNTVTAVPHLDYVAISISNPSLITANATLSTAYTPNSRVAFDGVVANNNLYVAWNANTGGSAIKMTLLSSTLTQGTTKTFASRLCTQMSVCADITGSTPNIYATFFDSASGDGYLLCVDASMNTILAPTQWQTGAGTVVKNISTAAQNGAVTILYEVTTVYGYGTAANTYLIKQRTCTSAGVLGTAAVVVRSLGLASRALIIDGVIYVLGLYSSPNQPGYFLVNISGKVIAKLAYQNAQSTYLATGAPNVTVVGSTLSFAYLIRDLIIPTNKTQGSTVSSAVYAQTGINWVTIDLTAENILTSEIGQNLHIAGGFLWMYDGYTPVEHGFFLYPDYVEVATSTSGGSISDQTYYYVMIYEWTDNQGNIHRSAPSIPTVRVTSGGNTSTNTINCPTYRLTYKTANPVKLVGYRWSTAQQTYYQFTSVTIPTLNSTTVDSVAITDTLADASIVGNSILYTTGGVIENISAPAPTAMTLFKSRFFMVDSEDKNLIWYSKQVIEGTPVELSDLFTIFVAPTIGAQGSTGDILALSSMDDKLIIFKRDAIYYITGNGPDNVGTNNDFSDPVFITSTIGCSNQNSIVLTPDGLMFQSGSEIWLLGRDLSTNYIGAPVEDATESPVVSAITVPDTNQVRFTLASGSTAVYDYYYAQWDTFNGIPGISSTVYQEKHTFIDQYGRVQKQGDGYLDGTSPVLMKLKTGWFNLAGLQGYERAYFFYLLGQFITPHKLLVEIAYDFAQAPSQSVIIQPTNYSGTYGDNSPYGEIVGQGFGGPGSLEQWKIFFQQQRCQSFQITITEIFDSTYGTVAGAGFTLSGINLVVGMKKGYYQIPTSNQRG